MELMCGKCLIPMKQVKMNVDKSSSFNTTENKGSYKCEHCGYIVMITWQPQLEKIEMK